MNAWLTRLLPQPSAKAPLPRRLVQVTVATPAAAMAVAGLPEPQDGHVGDCGGTGGEGDVLAGCGWFESSHALSQGLAVTEWAEADWAVAALYFLPVAGATAPSSLRLQ